MFVLVAHFLVESSAETGPIPQNAREPLDMLAAAPDCRRLHFARSTDTAQRLVLVAEFDSAATYRRALSPWPMRMVVIPWLSTAVLTWSEVSEVLFSSVEGAVQEWEPTVPDPGR